jgi:hypothetical protein
MEQIQNNTETSWLCEGLPENDRGYGMKNKSTAPKPTGYPPKKDIPKYTDNFRSIYDKRLSKKMQKNKTFQTVK